MKNLIKNWKTTSAGIVMCVLSVVNYVNHSVQLEVSLVTFLAGIGLILSKDGNKTGTAV